MACWFVMASTYRLNSSDRRASMNMPAVTMGAAWIKAEIGVGPSMESGSHTCNGTCEDLPMAPMNKQMQVNVIAGQTVLLLMGISAAAILSARPNTVAIARDPVWRY